MVNMFLHCIWDRFSIFIPFHCLLGKFACYLHRLLIPPPKNTIKFKQIGSSTCLLFWIWTICKGLSADDTSKQREKTSIQHITMCGCSQHITKRGCSKNNIPSKYGCTRHIIKCGYSNKSIPSISSSVGVPSISLSVGIQRRAFQEKIAYTVVHVSYTKSNDETLLESRVIFNQLKWYLQCLRGYR